MIDSFFRGAAKAERRRSDNTTSKLYGAELSLKDFEGIQIVGVGVLYNQRYSLSCKIHLFLINKKKKHFCLPFCSRVDEQLYPKFKKTDISL